MELKINIGDPKSKKTYKKELSGDDAKLLLGKKIGDEIKGELLNLKGYTLVIMGGSDDAGFPMRKSVHGSGRKKLFIGKSVGYRNLIVKKKGEKKLKAKFDGIKVRKTVAGNEIHEKTVQLNLKVSKAGTPALSKIFEAPKEEKPEDGQTSE